MHTHTLSIGSTRRHTTHAPLFKAAVVAGVNKKKWFNNIITDNMAKNKNIKVERE
jgi:hypothetical protein